MGLSSGLQWLPGMDLEKSAAEAESLRASLEDAREGTAEQIDVGLTDLGKRLRDATHKVGDSSSGSWVGWHSRMYFKGYAEPSAETSWNSEWGGVYGPQEGWVDRTQGEVQEAIERRANVTLAKLAEVADDVREQCEPLRQEVLTVLSPICDLAGLEKEAELLKQIEDIEWITPPDQYVRAMAPGQMMSRDSGAINQGMQSPLHVNVEAAIVSNTSTLARCRDFLGDAIRLTRQVSTKLATAKHAAPAALPAEQATAADVLQRRQLRRRSLALFALVAVAIVAGVAVLLWQVEPGRLVSAILIVGAALALAGLYAVLVDRGHARAALAVAAGVGGAVAAVDQLLSHV
jgi:hypothetical protein